jgi:hypothetical protein
MQGVVSDPVPVITEIRQIKNVKVSTLHAKAERCRDGFVKLFREHEHAFLLNEDGSEMLDRAGRRVSLKASLFAREMGIPKQTFHQWLNGRSVRNADPSPDPDQGWDLPGVPQEAVDKIRRAVEHNESLAELEDRRPFSAPDRIHIFRSWVSRMHADDLSDRGWKLLDEVQEQITRLYDELAESK